MPTVIVTKQTTRVVKVVSQGPQGADGADGQGVPVGGTAGQILSKIDGADYNTEWTDASSGGGGAWIVRSESTLSGSAAALAVPLTVGSVNIITVEPVFGDNAAPVFWFSEDQGVTPDTTNFYNWSSSVRYFGLDSKVVKRSYSSTYSFAGDWLNAYLDQLKRWRIVFRVDMRDRTNGIMYFVDAEAWHEDNSGGVFVAERRYGEGKILTGDTASKLFDGLHISTNNSINFESGTNYRVLTR
jgi:hypothetical protein